MLQENSYPDSFINRYMKSVLTKLDLIIITSGKVRMIISIESGLSEYLILKALMKEYLVS